MSRLEKLYYKMLDEAPFNFKEANKPYIFEFAKIYAREVAIASLEKASDKAEVRLKDAFNFNETGKSFSMEGLHISISKESITNPDNITLI